MAEVTKVNLPERTRARFEEESNIQRVQKPHDIRGAIPLVDYTNPAKFPPYKFIEYPKMPLLDGGRPIVIDESGGVLVFYDSTDEADFKQLNPDLVDELERNAPERSYADRVMAQENEIEDLRARLKAAGVEAPKRLKHGTKKNAVQKAMQARPPGEGGLRDNLPPNDKNPLMKKN